MLNIKQEAGDSFYPKSPETQNRETTPIRLQRYGPLTRCMNLCWLPEKFATPTIEVLYAETIW